MRFSQKLFLRPRFCSFCTVLVSLELIFYLKSGCISSLCITFIYPKSNLPFYCLVIQLHNVLPQTFSRLLPLGPSIAWYSKAVTWVPSSLFKSLYVEQVQAEIDTAVHPSFLCYKDNTLTPSLTSYSLLGLMPLLFSLTVFVKSLLEIPTGSISRKTFFTSLKIFSKLQCSKLPIKSAFLHCWSKDVTDSRGQHLILELKKS